MDPALFAYMQENEITELQKFNTKHEVYVLAFEGNPINKIGLERTHQLNEKFIQVIKDVKHLWVDQIWRADYFKQPLLVQHFMRWSPRFGQYFWYLILSVRERALIDRNRLRLEVKNKLHAMCNEFQLLCKVFCTENNREDVNFHISAQQMFVKLLEPSTGDLRPSFPVYNSIEEIPEEASFNFPKGKISVQDFYKIQRENAQFLANNVTAFSRFLRQEDREYKYTREEDLPFLAFLRHLNINANSQLALGRESAPVDFQIFRPDGSIIDIEVTQALPKNAHQYRKAIVASPFQLPLHERTLHQAGKDGFPNPIIEAISRKHSINYKGKPILLVSVLGDYTDEDDHIIGQWIDRIRIASSLGSFSQIFLVELARQKVIEIFNSQLSNKNKNNSQIKFEYVQRKLEKLIRKI